MGVFCTPKIPENRLLNEKDIAACSLNLLCNVENILAFFTKHTIHGSVVPNENSVVHLGKKKSACKMYIVMINSQRNELKKN